MTTVTAIRAGIYGATGYTGLELVRLLEGHPGFEIVFVTSESKAGTSLRASHPLAPDLTLVTAADAPLGEAEIVFLCLPHTQSGAMAKQAAETGVKVVDLSADLRLIDPALYEQWYKVPNPAPDLLPVPYGLPELVNRDHLKSAPVIANPGCYATTAALALVPVARAGLIPGGASLIVDAKSGVTGAGRSPKQRMLFGEVHGDFSPYSIGRAHRHIAEIEQLLDQNGFPPGTLIFSPHLLPTDRGILANCYIPVTDAAAAEQAIRETYHGEPLVTVLPPGELTTLRHTVRTPLAVLSVTPVSDEMIIVTSSLDNLLKGAASQAVQNGNLICGFEETAGLL